MTPRLDRFAVYILHRDGMPRFITGAVLPGFVAAHTPRRIHPGSRSATGSLDLEVESCYPSRQVLMLRQLTLFELFEFAPL